MLKKLNAILAIITALLLAFHAVSMSLLLCGIITFSPPLAIGGYALLCCFCVHALLSLIIMFFNKSAPERFYAAKNAQTVVQRVTAILLLILIHPHFRDYTYYVNDTLTFAPKTIFTFLPEILLTLCVCMHTTSSLSRAAVTLSLVNNQKGYAVFDIVSKIIFIGVGLFALSAITLYFWVLI